MKLRSPLHFQQLIFLILAFALCLGARSGWAQQDANVFYKVRPDVAAPMKVVGVTGTSLMVKDNFGEHGVPLAQILEIRMAEPAEVKAALQAYQSKDYTKALGLAKSVADKYKGLPATWAATASSLVGDIYLAQGDAAKAQAAYDDFAKAYPKPAGNEPDRGWWQMADLGRARLAVTKKDFETAKKTAEPLAQKALQEKNVTQASGQLYGQAFLVLGQIKEAQGDYQGALEEYLRTVTLFYHDPSATAIAQERADALRKTHAAFVP